MPSVFEEGMSAMREYLRENPNIKFVVIDTLPKLLRLFNSDKYDMAVLALERLEKIAQFFHVQIGNCLA
jgi:hypothetical protein